MRLALIADSDEVGQSGVGDYALSLAGAVERLKVTTEVFHLGEPASEQRRSLPKQISTFAPDWVSFQFVPYAYAQRGMVTHKTLPWQTLRGRNGTHFMFHEIWIGSHAGASFRDRITGCLQRWGIRSVMRTLSPDLVHCSNRLYSAMLTQAGIKNEILPLFGNIPVTAAASDPYESLVEALVPGSIRRDWVVAAFFGTIHADSSAVAVLRWLKEKAVRSNRCLLVVSLGHCPSATGHFQRWAEGLNDGSNVKFEVKGELPMEELSRWLSHADCGVSTTPFNIIEKSGSAAAFAEHGVPVLVTDRGASVRGCDFPVESLVPRFWLADDAGLSALPAIPPRRHPHGSVDEIAAKFLSDLDRA